ncbi:endonuclease [Pantoea rodasii]|uniref:Endonuclease n=1 Tax=Pantoea rodasii TaxID=1076549 RepID=A0A2M9W5J1_9GAMM|nr:endonuclease [Pantoea rodasii]
MKLSFSKLIIGGLMLFVLCLISRNTLCELRFKIFTAELSAVMAYEVKQ